MCNVDTSWHVYRSYYIGTVLLLSLSLCICQMCFLFYACILMLIYRNRWKHDLQCSVQMRWISWRCVSQCVGVYCNAYITNLRFIGDRGSVQSSLSRWISWYISLLSCKSLHATSCVTCSEIVCKKPVAKVLVFMHTIANALGVFVRYACRNCLWCRVTKVCLW